MASDSNTTTVFFKIPVLENGCGALYFLFINTLLETDEPETNSFLQTARALNLEGPSDWSVKLDQYLYGKETTDED